MIIQKVSILLIAFIISFLQPSGVESKPPKNSHTHSYNSPDSLLKYVSREGWNPERLSLMKYYFTDSYAPAENDLKLLIHLKNNFHKAFLQAVLFKKQNKFTEMYDTLDSHLNEVPHYLPYYNELVFAANASSRLELLESRIEASDKFPPRERNYLLGLINYKNADYGSAREHFEKCFHSDSTDKDILYQLSYSYRNLGDYNKALTYIMKASAAASDDNYFLVKAFLAEGALYFLSGEYDLADTTYKKAFNLARDEHMVENSGFSYVALGIMDDIQGFLDKARTKYKAAVDIAEKINNQELKAYAYSELGVSFSYTNELIEAKENYLKSYVLYKQMGNRLRLALLSENIGKIYMSIYNYESAISYYREGIEYSGDNKRSLVLNITGLADAYSNLSNYSESLKYYNEAKKLSREIKSIDLSIKINSGLGALYFNLDHPDNSLVYYLQAESECSKINNPFLTADIYDKLGTVYSALDSLNIAEQYFSEAEKIAGENQAAYTALLAAVNRAEVLVKKEEYTKALVLLNSVTKRSSSGNFSYIQARAENLRGSILEKSNDFEGALSAYNRTLEIVKNLNEKTLEVEAYFNLAKLNDSRNLNDAAENYYRLACALIEDVSRPLFSQEDVQISYFSGNRNVYDSFAEHYLRLKNYRAAFELINKSQSRSMLQNLNNLKLQTLLEDSTVLSKLYDYDWIIHSGIYNREKTEKVKGMMAELKHSLVSSRPELRPYLNMEYESSINEIQNSLYGNENLISYYSTENSLYAFLINKKSFTPFKFDISSKQLIKMIGDISPYFESIKEKSDAYFNQDLFSFNAEASNILYKKIVEPVIKDIPHEQKIIISPCVELISIPLEFLVTSYSGDESPYSYNNKKFLLSDYDISYSPSASAFLQQQKNSLKNNGKTLLVGDPSINAGSKEFAERRGLLDEPPGIPRNLALLPLKYSGEEVSSIGEIINASTILLNKNATETNFKENAEMSRVIHLSTHSFLYKKQPLIFFSNTYDAENDGFLEAGEIVRLKLNSDLVVLSSCNSGLGSIDKSEGILGLTKAFFEAGSKSVVVSLWDVNDRYTSKLMTLFYEKLSMGYDKSRALRLAKSEFIKKYSPNPYYWSAFVLSGNISPVSLKPYKSVSISIMILLIIIAAALVVVVINRKRFKV